MGSKAIFLLPRRERIVLMMFECAFCYEYQIVRDRYLKNYYQTLVVLSLLILPLFLDFSNNFIHTKIGIDGKNCR